MIMTASLPSTIYCVSTADRVTKRIDTGPALMMHSNVVRQAFICSQVSPFRHICSHSSSCQLQPDLSTPPHIQGHGGGSMKEAEIQSYF